MDSKLVMLRPRNYPRMLAQNLWHLPVICNYFNLVTILQSISFPPSLIFTVANLVLVAALQGFVAMELNRATFLQRINSKELFKRKTVIVITLTFPLCHFWLIVSKTNASFLSKGETEKNRPLHNFLPLVPPVWHFKVSRIVKYFPEGSDTNTWLCSKSQI